MHFSFRIFCKFKKKKILLQKYLMNKLEIAIIYHI